MYFCTIINILNQENIMEVDSAAQSFVAVRERNYAKCLGEGLKIVGKNFGSMVGFLWPLAVLYAVVYIVGCFVQMSALPNVLRGEAWKGETCVIIMYILSIIVSAAYGACMFWQQRQLVAGAGVPKARIWKIWRDVLPLFWRMLSLVCLYVVIAFVLVFLFCLLVSALSSAPASGVLLTCVSVVAFCVLVLLCTLFSLVTFEYMLENCSLGAAIGSLRWSWRYFGRTLVVTFLCILVVAVVCLVLSAPSMVCSYIEAVVLATRLEGDVADLPGSFACLLFLGWLLSALGSCLGTLLFSYPLCLNWGAIHATENERMSKLEQD